MSFALTTTVAGELLSSNRGFKTAKTSLIVVAAKLSRAGREMKLIIEKPNNRRIPDVALLRVVARARDVQIRLEANTGLTVQDIASAEGVSSAYIYSLLRLRWLAPSIVTAIVDGRQPEKFTARDLMRLSARLPTQWNEQRTLLGFR